MRGHPQGVHVVDDGIGLEHGDGNGCPKQADGIVEGFVSGSSPLVLCRVLCEGHRSSSAMMDFFYFKHGFPLGDGIRIYPNAGSTTPRRNRPGWRLARAGAGRRG